MPFNEIPNDIRVPFSYIEFDASRATQGLAGQQRKLLVIGQQLPAGAATANEVNQVLSADQADALYGRGSMLAEMIRHLKAANNNADVWAIGQADDGAAAAATGDISFTGPASEAGTLYLYIGGYRITVGVDNADTADDIATAVAAAITADDRVPVTAAVNGVTTSQVDITARHKGETGNDIDLRVNYYTGEALPAGVGATITAMSGGTTNPDITAAIAALGDEQYHSIAMPYTDAANLTALETELADRWGPIRQIEGIAFTAFRGTAAESTTFGDGRNSRFVSCMGTGTAPHPTWLWAAVNAAVAEQSLAIDPARPLQTLVLTGLLPPAPADRFTWNERNLLLHDGISTHTVDAGGQVLIERQITMYQENAAGFPDTAYLDVNTPATLGNLRYQVNARILAKFPRHKLADNGAPVAPGQAIVTPDIVKQELVALARELADAGQIENVAQFTADLTVERNDIDPNRLDVYMSPDLVNQFRVTAGQVQFLL